MGVVLARTSWLAARANQNPPYAPAPGPAPLLPAPFRISANLSTLGSPRAWAATGWAGLTVLRGAPPLSGWQRAAVSPPPTPAKNTSRLRSPGVAAAGSVAPPPPPQLESPELPATSATEPREPGRAPPLKSTGARSLALHQTMGTPEEPRPPGGRSRDGPRPYCLHARTGSEPHSWPRPLPTKPRPQGPGTKAETPPEPHTKDEHLPPARSRGPRLSKRPPLAARRPPGWSLTSHLRCLSQASTHLLAPSRLATL